MQKIKRKESKQITIESHQCMREKEETEEQNNQKTIKWQQLHIHPQLL